MPSFQLPFADLNFGASPADTYRMHAAKLNFKDYLAVARTSDVDQVFWRCLLPADGLSDGVALILETRLGMLSARFAPYFKSVISWHASVEAAEITRQRAESHGLGNIRIVVAPRMADLDLGKVRLSAAIFYCPSRDLTRQWGDNMTALLDSMLQRLPEVLADDGVVLIGENNCRSYKNDGAQPTSAGRIGGVSVPGIKQKIRRNFPNADLYVCSSVITSVHSPFPDFVRQDAYSVGSIFPKNWISSIKNRLLNMRAVRLLWPSFLLVASKHRFQSMLHEILHQPDVVHKLDWKTKDKVAVKRIVAGNLGTTIIIVGHKNCDTYDIVVRLPNSESARKLCRVNSLALKKLADTSLRDMVPCLLSEGIWKHQAYTIESHCPGLEIFYGTRNLKEMVREACQSLTMLHLQTAMLTRLGNTHFDEQVAPLIHDVAKYCNPDVRVRLHNFTQELRSSLIGRETSLGYTHGDFKVGNILFDRSRKFSALIDWDGFAENGFQIFDYLTLLLYMICNDKNRGFAEVYLEYLLPWNLPPEYESLVEEPVSRLAGDWETFLLIRIVFWFSHISTRFDPVYKFHADWQHAYLHSVLPAFECLCKAGWKFFLKFPSDVR